MVDDPAVRPSSVWGNDTAALEIDKAESPWTLEILNLILWAPRVTRNVCRIVYPLKVIPSCQSSGLSGSCSDRSARTKAVVQIGSQC